MFFQDGSYSRERVLRSLMNQDHRGTEAVGGSWDTAHPRGTQVERLCPSHPQRAQPFLPPTLPREHRKHRVPGTVTRQTWKDWEALAGKKHSPAHPRLSWSPSQAWLCPAPYRHRLCEQVVARNEEKSHFLGCWGVQVTEEVIERLFIPEPVMRTEEWWLCQPHGAVPGQLMGHTERDTAPSTSSSSSSSCLTSPAGCRGH